VRWSEFAEACPDLAEPSKARLLEPGIALLGTLRADGSPRISPCEVFIVDGDLMLGMMWQSRKALDLLRDPRIVVHSAVTNRDGKEGDVKLYGRAVDVPEPERRAAYADHLENEIDWRPTEPLHLFALDITSAGYTMFGDAPHALAWDPDRGLRRLPVGGA
jgi:pyridoxamine 5'-phosphate oxidase-like protein